MINAVDRLLWLCLAQPIVKMNSTVCKFQILIWRIHKRARNDRTLTDQQIIYLFGLFDEMPIMYAHTHTERARAHVYPNQGKILNSFH